ncbi:hypothetical protein F2Q69_00055031 [Brassica cretica]|uniref:Uncharacterized protein n=2 Tax=Brassica TaxID=3705 RepID=A0A8S9MZU2_BRACR|nr:hypothetical protein F2Q69_00055031 [Brassica cretica]
MMFCGVLSPLMNCIKPSSNKNISLVRTDMRSKYSSDLEYYTSFCQQDSDLKTFDSSLHQRTISVMKSLANQAARSQSISQGTLMEVYEFPLDLNRDVISATPSITSQLIIRYAVKQFEAESVDTDNKKNKYAKTLEELSKFKAMGDPFDGEFLTQCESVYEQQVLLLEELGKLKAKLDKKQRNVKIWRRLSSVVFITAFVSALILSVAAPAMSAPVVLTVVASGLSTPIDVVGKWCNEMWKKYENAVRRQRELVLSVETGARVNKIARKNYESKLRIRISSVLETVEFAVEREEDEVAMILAVQEIKKIVDGLTDKIKEVGQHAAMFSGLIAVGRLVVLKHIRTLPSNSVS